MAYDTIYIDKDMEPIEVATKLVTADRVTDNAEETGRKVFTPGQLRQIAEYLTVYANQETEREVNNG